MNAVRPGLTILAVACLGALTTGCTRTSDGSIEFHRPVYETPGWFKRRASTAPAEAAVFPAPPPAPQPVVAARSQPVRKAQPRPRRTAVQKPVAQPPVSADPPAPVTCRNVTQAGGRVKYVCQ